LSTCIAESTDVKSISSRSEKSSSDDIIETYDAKSVS
jgi:hypothetical protein